MKTCRATLDLLLDRAARRTLTTAVIALGSSIVLALAGCASPDGFEPEATLVAPASPGAEPAITTTPTATD